MEREALYGWPDLFDRSGMIRLAHGPSGGPVVVQMGIPRWTDRARASPPVLVALPGPCARLRRPNPRPFSKSRDKAWAGTLSQLGEGQ